MSCLRPSRLALLACVLAGLAAGEAAGSAYTVRGRATTADGPLAGARVRLFHHPSPTYLWPEDEPPGAAAAAPSFETISGSAGRFELQAVFDPGELHYGLGAGWLLEVTSPGLARRVVEVPRAGGQMRPGGVEDVGSLLLSPGRVVVGRVRSRGEEGAVGGPLGGVRVSLWPQAMRVPEPWWAETRLDGRFEIDAVPDGDYVALLDGPGLDPRVLERVSVPPGGGEAVPVDLGTVPLARAAGLAGRVTDRRGEPIAGARVLFRPHLPPVVARDWLASPATGSGAGGEFSLAGAAAQLPADLRVHRPGYRVWEEEVRAEPGPGGVRRMAPVVLEERVVVCGRVVDGQGRGVPGARLEPAVSPGAILFLHTVEPDGGFEIDVGKKGKHRFRVHARGFRDRQVVLEAAPVAAATEAEPIVLEAVETVDLNLAVSDAEGAPVAGAEITLRLEHRGAFSYYERTWADEQGRCRLEKVPAGETYSLEVQHPEHLPYRRGGLEIAAGQDRLAVMLPPRPWRLVALHGRVLDPEGAPVEGARVTLSEMAGGREPGKREASTGPGGAFELTRVREGACRLTVAAPGLAPWVAELEALPEAPPVEVVLSAGATLEGRVRGLPPERVSGLSVQVSGPGLDRPRPAQASGDRFRLDGLGEGLWSVAARSSGTHVAATVEIVPGQRLVRLDLDFPPLFEVRGSLLLDGRPGRGQVFLRTLPGGVLHQSYSASLDERGRFAFPGVAGGAYQLSCFTPAGPVTREVTVAADLDLLLDVPTVVLRGRVVDAATGDGVGDADIEAFGSLAAPHGPRFTAITDAAGWFEIGPVAEGRWTVHARAAGYLPKRRPVEGGTSGEPLLLALTASSPVP